MLKKSFRVGKHLFDELKSTKPTKYIKNPFFTIKYYKNDNKKFAVVISKHTIKKASKRVKIKRDLKRCISENLNVLPDGVYILIVTSSAIIEGSYEKICSEFNSSISKIP